MAGMLVRIFKSRRREGGIDTLDVRVVAVETGRPSKQLAPDGYDAGLLGVIERMFSGLLMDHAVQGGEAASRKSSSTEGEAPPSHHFTSADLDVLTTIIDPRVDTLTHGASSRSLSIIGHKVAIGDAADPARPHGLLEDAQGLGTDAYSDVVAAENETKAGSESPPWK